MRVLVYSTGMLQNEPICGYASVVNTSSSFGTHTYTHTDTPYEDREPTGKVDIAAVYSLPGRPLEKKELSPVFHFLSLSRWSPPHLPQCQSTSVSVALVSTLATCQSRASSSASMSVVILTDGTTE